MAWLAAAINSARGACVPLGTPTISAKNGAKAWPRAAIAVDVLPAVGRPSSGQFAFAATSAMVLVSRAVLRAIFYVVPYPSSFEGAGALAMAKALKDMVGLGDAATPEDEAKRAGGILPASLYP